MTKRVKKKIAGCCFLDKTKDGKYIANREDLYNAKTFVIDNFQSEVLKASVRAGDILECKEVKYKVPCFYIDGKPTSYYWVKKITAVRNISKEINQKLDGIVSAEKRTRMYMELYDKEMAQIKRKQRSTENFKTI